MAIDTNRPARSVVQLLQPEKVSQEELAHRAGLDRTYISALERNVYNPTIDVVGRLGCTDVN